MFYEIKIAQSFVLSLLYNKLPRRRVNLFGDELEAALTDKFADHWYPDMPFKGSAYRCLKLTDPSDLVLIRAATESGNPISNIIENLPADLAIWIDPGEVSFRIGEKGSVKLLYTSDSKHKAFAEKNGLLANIPLGVDIIHQPTPIKAIGSPPLLTDPIDMITNVIEDPPSGKDLNLDQGLIPVENLNSIFTSMSLSCENSTPAQSSTATPAGFSLFTPRPQQPVTYTAGTFAQTKFGSTKLKTNGKKAHRMSPTEFSNYIKQRAMQKQSGGISQGVMGGTTQTAPTSNQRNGFRNGFPNQRQFQNLNNSARSNHQISSDNYFYPILSERNLSGNEISPSTSVSSFYSAGMNGGSLPSSGPPSASSISSQQWRYVDQEGDLLSQDFYYSPTNKPGYRGMTFGSDLFPYNSNNPDFSNSYNDSFSIYSNNSFESAVSSDDFSNPGKVFPNQAGLPKDISSPSTALAPRVMVAN